MFKTRDSASTPMDCSCATTRKTRAAAPRPPAFAALKRIKGLADVRRANRDAADPEAKRSAEVAALKTAQAGHNAQARADWDEMQKFKDALIAATKLTDVEAAKGAARAAIEGHQAYLDRRHPNAAQIADSLAHIRAHAAKMDAYTANLKARDVELRSAKS